MCACVLVVQRGEDRHGTLVKGECEWMGVVQVCVCVWGCLWGRTVQHSLQREGRKESHLFEITSCCLSLKQCV